VTIGAAVLLSVALVLVAVDWFAVGTGRKTLEFACKPAATIGFLATAVALDPASATERAWFVGALAACLVGDVLLMLPRDAFLGGLAAFVVAHLCFTAGFATSSGSGARLLVGAAAVALVAIPLATRFVRAMRASGQAALVAPVIGYVAVIGAMVAAAIAAGNGWGIAGAVLFLVSDALIGETRFVAPRPWGAVAVMVTYHLALTGLVVSLV
jgi:alkenylglycerophosphocholine/alkenylglycerophosphoethanolamine hydrolase